ncbi:MAG: outer membrane protein transport protein [Labilithrix sp.]|nr:outer membrane protein transport protein [Labilithrix sp.]
MRKTCAGLAALLLCATSNAHAGGLYFSDRGVRPIGRAGAFVAGADDLGAIWYNPAGVADAKTSVLVDFAMLRFSSDYTRQLRVVDADDTVRYVRSPQVSGTSPVIPFPTLAASYAFGREKEWTIAGGAYAPYPAIATYPETVDGQPSPARYALGSFDGSALILLGGTIAYKPTETLRLGLGLGALVGFFQSTVTFSVSPPDRLVANAEQPEYDAASSFRVGPIFSPTANLGAIWSPIKELRLGASFQLPIVVSSGATFDVRLPNAAIFDGARVAGNEAHVKFVLPPILRFGVEVRPADDLRVELAYVRELWGVHDSIDLTPENVAIEGISGLPKRVPIPPIRFPRGFTDSNSYRLGAEYSFDVGGYPLDLRAGLAYETSAIPRPYLSLLTIDMDKVTLSFGGSIHIGQHWRLDAVYAHLFASSVNVSPDEARIPRVNPIAGNAPLEAVNGGRYSASGDLLGVGFRYIF